MARVNVPLSHRPEPVEVDRDEIPGLIAQGLLKKEDVPPEEGAPAGAPSSRPGEAAPAGHAKTKSAGQQGA